MLKSSLKPFVCVLSLGPMCVSAADALNYWQAVGGVSDGAYADAAHWSLGAVPDVGVRAYFALDASYAVTFPTGDFTNNAALKPAAFPGRTVELDGRATTLVRTCDPTGRYPSETFGLYYGGTAYALFNFEKYSATPNADKAADYAISNFICRVSSSGENRVRGTFVQGGYNFFDPEGTTWTSPASPYVTFFGNVGSPLVEAEVVLGAETSFRFPTVRLQGNALTNRLVFAGGTHTFAGLAYLPYTQGGTALNDTDAATDAATDLILQDGASVAFLKGTMVGVADVTKGVRRRWHVAVAPGAHLRHGGYVSHYHGQVTVDVAGEWTCADDIQFNRGNNDSSAHIVVRDGGLLTTAAGTAFKMGVGDSPDAPSSLTVTNASVLNAAQMTVGATSFTDARLVTTGQFDIGYAPTLTRATFTGCAVTNSSNFTPGAQGPAHVEFRDTAAHFTGAMYIGGRDTVAASAATATVSVVGGTFALSGDAAQIFVGYPANRTGVFSFNGGELTATRTAPLSVGWFGAGVFNLSGGTVSVNHLRTGVTYTQGTDGTCEDVVRVTGGVLDITSRQQGYGLSVSEHANRCGRLILNGGVVKCHQVWGSNGTSAFEADGGTLEAIQSNTYQLSGFGEARLGAKGLTLDSAGYDITVAQSFSDKADAAGTGRLILTGAGTKTLTGDLSGLSCVEVRGGLVDLTGRTVQNLILDGGVLKVDPNRPITVTGSCDFSNVCLALADGLTRGNAYSVLTLAQPLDDAQLEKWTQAVATAGLADGDALTPTQVSDGAGGYTLRLEVRAAETTAIRLEAGTETRADDYANSAADVFDVFVATDADLTLTGVLARGALVKAGGGALTLAHADNLLVGGWRLDGGRLCAPTVAALGLGRAANEKPGVLCDGTLELTGADAQAFPRALEIRTATPTNGVIMKVAGEVTMPAPTVASGSFIKRGGGRLVWEVAGAQTLVAGRGVTSSRGGAWPFTQDQILPLAFDEANGTVPTDGSYGCFNVTDGEMVLRGRDTDAAARVKGVVTVGVPTRDGSVQPGLVVDRVAVDFVGSGQHLVLAPGGSADNTFVSEPYLVVSNGAAVTVDTLSVNRFNDRADLVTRVTVADGSTLKAAYMLQPNRSQNGGGRAEYEIVGASRLLAGSQGVSLFRPVKMTFDGSVLAKNEALEPTRIFAEVGTLASAWLDATFRAGAEFRCAEIAPATAVTAANPIRLTFDDAKWIPTTADEDYTFAYADPAQVVIAVTNAGLVLDVPAARTWTLNHPVTGAGGLVKRGAGTLTLGAVSVAYTGVTRCDAGVVDLGGAAQPLRFGGAGTVANGTIAKGGLVVTLADDGTVVGPVPTLRDVATRGRFKVDVGRAAADVPLVPPYRTVVVAKYDGAAPDVSGWKAVNMGVQGLSATFAAQDGFVYMTPSARGLLLIVK